MKKFLIISALAAATFHAAAGLSSGLSGPMVVVVAAAHPRAVTAHLDMPADFVSVPIRVYSDQKDTAHAYEETGQAVDLICQKAQENGQFRVLRGEISLSQHEGGWGISSGSWSQPAGSADIYLLVPFTDERTNIFAAGAEAARFIAALDLPEKTHYQLGSLQLAVENPEQYRDKLLHLIAVEIAGTRQALGAQGSVKVEGLEKPVIVGQTDDRNVELYLGYSLSITSDK